MRYSKPFYQLLGCLMSAQLLSHLDSSAQSGMVFAASSTTKTLPQYQQRPEGSNEKKTLFNVLKELNKKKGTYFLFSEQSLGNKLVNNVKDQAAPVEKILDEILKNTGLKYTKVSDNTFVIIKDKEKIANDKLQQLNFTEEEPDAPAAGIFDPISGRITDDKGNPLEGVSITLKGTNRGTTTNRNGDFTIDAKKGDVLIISYVGYAEQAFTIGSTDKVTISLSQGSQQMTEVVVTALGIKKERKALGYSVTEVKGNELTQARETNVANSLVGKVAGVNVNSVSGGPGASTSVLIRGVSGLASSQPLYVINGVPMTNLLAEGNNLQNASGQYYNSSDYGDGIQNINPDDIETISVLKGAAASALYGSRAKAGVILITTKSGTGKGTVELNSNFTADQVIDLTDWQYEYGNGANGLKPTTGTAAYDAGNSSWGAKLDGSNVVQFDGVSRPYSAQKGNLGRFYRTGSTATNTISFGRAFDGGSIRFSASNLYNTAVIPNSGLNRNTFNLSTVFTVTKGLTIDAKVNYVMDKARNRPILGDGAGNANFQAMFLPTSLDINTLKPGTKPDGNELLFTNNTYATNPWFAADKFINNTTRNRLIATANARYTFDNGFFIQARAGRDFYYDRYTGVVPNGTGYYAQAFRNITETYFRISELNTDVLIGKTFKVNSDLRITANAGGNMMKARVEGTTEGGSNFAVPYVYTILNAKNKTIEYLDKRKEVNSVYGTIDIAYKNFLYLNASARNDWFSTLAPSPDLDVFYPSVNASFVFTEFVKPSWLNYGKLRAGWANVGGGADEPYQTLLNYNLFPVQLNGLPLGTITNQAIPNKNLRPSEASEIEIGTELGLFGNKLTVDFAWYTKKSKKEIVQSPASITSGYTGVFLNLGELENKGFELLLTGRPLAKGSAFSWTTSLNGAINNNKVVSLTEGQAELPVATSRTGFGFTRHIVGLPSNQIMAFDYKYDAAGKIVVAANGVPERGDLIAMGSAYHKYTMGWNNEFTWKDFTMSFLIDGKFGGKIFSATDYYGYFFGLQKGTLPGRESNFNPDPAGQPTNAQAYYTQLAGNVSRLFVYDADFIKFRQFTLGYTMPAKWFNNKIKGISLSLVGRNLFFIKKKTDNIDPEASYSGFSQGLELGGVPPVRSYGLNLNVKL